MKATLQNPKYSFYLKAVLVKDSAHPLLLTMKLGSFFESMRDKIVNQTLFFFGKI